MTSTAAELRVDRRLGEGEAEELVQAVPGGGEQEDRERRVRDRVDAQDKRLGEPGMLHGE